MSKNSSQNPFGLVGEEGGLTPPESPRSEQEDTPPPGGRHKQLQTGQVSQQHAARSLPPPRRHSLGALPDVTNQSLNEMLGAVAAGKARRQTLGSVPTGGRRHSLGSVPFGGPLAKPPSAADRKAADGGPSIHSLKGLEPTHKNPSRETLFCLLRRAVIVGFRRPGQDVARTPGQAAGDAIEKGFRLLLPGTADHVTLREAVRVLPQILPTLNECPAQTLQSLAELLDQDRDGLISREDWTSVLQNPGERFVLDVLLADVATRIILRYGDVDACFQAFDTERLGFLQREHWRSGLSEFGVSVLESDQLYALMDENKSGVLEREEMEMVIHSSPAFKLRIFFQRAKELLGPPPQAEEEALSPRGEEEDECARLFDLFGERRLLINTSSGRSQGRKLQRERYGVTLEMFTAVCSGRLNMTKEEARQAFGCFRLQLGNRMSFDAFREAHASFGGGGGS